MMANRDGSAGGRGESRRHGFGLARLGAGLLIAAVMAGVAAPGEGAVIRTRDGESVTGTILHTLVQRATVRQIDWAQGVMSTTSIYTLIPGSTISAIDTRGVVRRGGQEGVILVRELNHREPPGESPEDTASTRATGGHRFGYSERLVGDPADREILERALGSDVEIPFTHPEARDTSVALVPRPRTHGMSANTELLLGELNPSPQGRRLEPSVTVQTDTGEVRVPVREIAEFQPSEPAPPNRVMKVRREVSLRGGSDDYRVTAIEVENTGRRAIGPDLLSTGGEAVNSVGPDAPGVVWVFVCELEAPHGVGFNLAGLYQSFTIRDGLGREIHPILKDSHGFETERGAYVRFLAIGPADSRRISFGFGGSVAEVPVR